MVLQIVCVVDVDVGAALCWSRQANDVMEYNFALTCGVLRNFPVLDSFGKVGNDCTNVVAPSNGSITTYYRTTHHSVADGSHRRGNTTKTAFVVLMSKYESE